MPPGRIGPVRSQADRRAARRLAARCARRPARCTTRWARGRRGGSFAPRAAARSRTRRSPENTPRDSGQARRAKARDRYRRSRLPQSVRASAAAAARHTTVASAAVQARGTGRSLPSRGVLAATTGPLLTSPVVMFELPLRQRRADVACRPLDEHTVRTVGELSAGRGRRRLAAHANKEASRTERQVGHGPADRRSLGFSYRTGLYPKSCQAPRRPRFAKSEVV